MGDIVLPVNFTIKTGDFMIKVKLKDGERKELEALRRQASAKDSEKILMVLLSHDGLSSPEIARRLKRHPHTVRDWLKRFQAQGVKGLQRLFSPGRPNDKREAVKEAILEVLNVDPTSYGYKEFLWNVPLIAHYLKQSKGIVVSNDTIERALKDCGFTYKRPSKSVSPKAPDREAKKAAVGKIVWEIQELLSGGDWEIFALDESHFSTEPYIARGWIKKRWPPKDTRLNAAEKRHILWSIESEDAKILLEKVSKI